MKRFYEKAGIARSGSGWQVTLDGRPIKTVKGAPQLVPTEALARLLLAEWDIEGEELDPKAFPLRDMADYALDVVATERDAHAARLIAYAQTDTLLYRADPDEPLHSRQCEVWDPLLEDFEARERIALTRVSGVVHRAQPDASIAALGKKIASLDPFALAATEALASLAASLVVALSAIQAEEEADAVMLWRAACLDEDWQADQWGRDKEAEARRADRQARFLAAWKFAHAAHDI